MIGQICLYMLGAIDSLLIRAHWELVKVIILKIWASMS